MQFHLMISRSAGAAAELGGPIHAVPLNVDACYVYACPLPPGFCETEITECYAYVTQRACNLRK